MRKALIIGNWKMHKTVVEAVGFARELAGSMPVPVGFAAAEGVFKCCGQGNGEVVF